MKDLEYNLNLQNQVKSNFTKLLDIACNMILLNNVPGTLLENEIKKDLILNGYGVITDLEEFGIVSIPNTSLFGVTPYTDIFSHVKYGNPVFKSKELEIDKDCILIKNTSNYLSCYELLNKYAILLSDIDISLDVTIVNTRLTSVFNVQNETQKKSIELLYQKIREGYYSILEGDNLMEKISNIALSNQVNHTSIQELLTARNNIMRSFFAEFGVSMSKDKSQAILSDETESNNPSLEVDIDIIYKSWLEGFEKVNEMYGTNIEVVINPKYKPVENENENVSRETTEDEEQEEQEKEGEEYDNSK